jgi:hypothetical protein
MTPRQLLSPQARVALFDPPMEVRAIVRHYTFSIEDVALVRQRRRNANHLGFPVHLAYLRFPGQVLGPNETPPAQLLAFIADQLQINPKAFGDYAQRDETRREHLAELQAYLGCGRLVAKTTGPWAGSLSTSRLVPTVARQSSAPWWSICGSNLFSSLRLRCSKRSLLAARARARKQAYKALTAGVDQAVREKLDGLIQVAERFPCTQANAIRLVPSFASLLPSQGAFNRQRPKTDNEHDDYKNDWGAYGPPHSKRVIHLSFPHRAR